MSDDDDDFDDGDHNDFWHDDDFIDYNELYPPDDGEFDDDDWVEYYDAITMEGLTVSRAERLKWKLRAFLHWLKYIGRHDPWQDIPF